MKTSNKILLGTLVTAMLLFVSLHATIYIKYKKGQYSLVKQWTYKKVSQLEGINFVSLENVKAYLFNSDTSSLSLANEHNEDWGKVEYVRRGDSLFVFVNKPNLNKAPVQLNITKNVLLKAASSEVSLAGNENGTAAPSFHLELDNSDIDVNNNFDSKMFYYSSLNIDAKNNSHIRLYNAVIGLADISLWQSNMNLQETSIDSLKLRNDKASNVWLSQSSISGMNK
jgi:hypothetical protein